MRGHNLVAACLLGLLLLVGCQGPTFEEGLEAYQEGRYTEAAEIWRDLARSGHPEAQYHLGHLYRAGLGVPRKPDQAARWFRRAAQQGNAPAQFNLAYLYEEGQGVERDPAAAYKWYRLAEAGLSSRARQSEARQHAEGLAEELSPERLRTLRQELEDWSPHPEGG